MSQKKILPFGYPTLRKVAKPVDEITPKTIRLLDDMAETLYACGNGAGDMEKNFSLPEKNFWLAVSSMKWII